MSDGNCFKKKLDRVLRCAFDSLAGAKIIVDEKGIVLYASKYHYQYLGYNNPEDMIGKPVEDVIPGTRMHIVVQTETPEYGYIFRFIHKETKQVTPVVCNRIPLYDNGTLVGAMSETIFPHGMDDVLSLAREIERLDASQRSVQMQADAGRLDSIILGNAPSIVALRQMIYQTAAFPLPVLITGETGTGKEVFAHAIHALSPFSEGNYVKINCAAIPGELLESELFGYEGGAFSGASRKGKIGKFEYAGHGSVLLDEIGDMPLHLQAKLLRAIQEKEFEKVGGLTPIPFSARIICTTNCDLQRQITLGKFRQDLFYRINVIEMNIPPLRERKEDIKLFCDYFLHEVNRQYGLRIVGVESDAIEYLTKHDWPGNVRELRHVVERACFVRSAGMIRREDLSLDSKPAPPSVPTKPEKRGGGSILPLDVVRAQAEADMIRRALDEANGNKAEAARLLRIDRTILYDKMKKYKL